MTPNKPKRNLVSEDAPSAAATAHNVVVPEPPAKAWAIMCLQSVCCSCKQKLYCLRYAGVRAEEKKVPGHSLPALPEETLASIYERVQGAPPPMCDQQRQKRKAKQARGRNEDGDEEQIEEVPEEAETTMEEHCAKEAQNDAKKTLAAAAKAAKAAKEAKEAKAAKAAKAKQNTSNKPPKQNSKKQHNPVVDDSDAEAEPEQSKCKTKVNNRELPSKFRRGLAADMVSVSEADTSDSDDRASMDNCLKRPACGKQPQVKAKAKAKAKGKAKAKAKCHTKQPANAAAGQDEDESSGDEQENDNRADKKKAKPTLDKEEEEEESSSDKEHECEPQAPKRTGRSKASAQDKENTSGSSEEKPKAKKGKARASCTGDCDSDTTMEFDTGQQLKLYNRECQ